MILRHCALCQQTSHAEEIFHFNNHLILKALWVRLLLHQLQILVDQPGVGLHQHTPGLIPVHHDLSAGGPGLAHLAVPVVLLLGGGQVSSAHVDPAASPVNFFYIGNRF